MLCIICKRKFNKDSSYYRHVWSDKHLLRQQLLENEKEIKILEQTIAQIQNQGSVPSTENLKSIEKLSIPLPMTEHT